jgi:hypothetical protein
VQSRNRWIRMAQAESILSSCCLFVVMRYLPWHVVDCRRLLPSQGLLWERCCFCYSCGMRCLGVCKWEKTGRNWEKLATFWGMARLCSSLLDLWLALLWLLGPATITVLLLLLQCRSNFYSCSACPPPSPSDFFRMCSSDDWLFLHSEFSGCYSSSSSSFFFFFLAFLSLRKKLQHVGEELLHHWNRSWNFACILGFISRNNNCKLVRLPELLLLAVLWNRSPAKSSSLLQSSIYEFSDAMEQKSVCACAE